MPDYSEQRDVEGSTEEPRKTSNLTKLLLAGGLLGGALALFYSNNSQNTGRTVFDGAVNGMPTKYEEGLFCESDITNSTMNQMTIKTGEVSINLIDYDNETSIYDEEPNFKDTIEEVVYTAQEEVFSRIKRDQPGTIVQTPDGNIELIRTPMGIGPKDVYFNTVDGEYNLVRLGIKTAEKLGIGNNIQLDFNQGIPLQEQESQEEVIPLEEVK